MRYVWIAIGVLAALAGAVWTLQGLNIMGGSQMSGDPTWAVVGPIVFVVGVLLFLFGIRRRDTSN
jgi:hypothetical protein